MMNQRLSLELNRLRWLAAFFVVICHVRKLLFVSYADVADKNLAVKAFYFFTGFGHEAVMIFFVISGFLVGGIAAQKYLLGRFDAKDFIIHRFTRIYIVLIPALLVGYLLDQAGINYFDRAHVYTQSTLFRFDGIVSQRLDWETIFGNGLMLQKVFVSVAGSNGPLWSLSYEWWYYCIFFFGLSFLSLKTHPRMRILFGAGVPLLLCLLPYEMALWFVIWLLGVAIGFSPLRRIRIPPAAAYCVFLAVLAWSRIGHADLGKQGMLISFAHDFVVAAGCFLLLTAYSARAVWPYRANRTHAVLAGFSYTTYLFHFPFMLFVIAFLDSEFGIPFSRQPGIGGIIYFVLLTCLVYLYCYAFSLVTENYTQALRSWFGRLGNSKNPLLNETMG